MIFDAEDQPDILTPLSQNGASRDEHSKNCGPFIPEQESPLQRPRPPERLQPPPRKRSFQNRWSQRLSSAVIINRNPNNFTNQRLTPLLFCAMPTFKYFWPFQNVLTSHFANLAFSKCPNFTFCNFLTFVRFFPKFCLGKFNGINEKELGCSK